MRLFWALLLAGRLHLGIATDFSAANDPWNPSPALACTGRALDDSRDMVVAHPKLPCGTEVWIYDFETGRSARARVEDRGPRRAMVDLAPAVSRALRSRGMDRVLMVDFSGPATGPGARRPRRARREAAPAP